MRLGAETTHNASPIVKKRRLSAVLYSLDHLHVNRLLISAAIII